MSYPIDVFLPTNAKFFGFIDPKLAYNPNWDITWSFTYALTGIQHGFCTFLSPNPSLSSQIPGQYMGYLGNTPFLSIAFDSTGYFALSNTKAGGISQSSTKKNSLIVRDINNTVIFNEHLSSLDTNFILASSSKIYNTLRFRYANAGKKLYIDYHKDNDKYKNLTAITMSSYNLSDNDIVYPGVTFSSPISSTLITPSTLWLSNFHTQGNTLAPNYETLEFIPLTSIQKNGYTTLDAVTATVAEYRAPILPYPTTTTPAPTTTTTPAPNLTLVPTVSTVLPYISYPYTTHTKTHIGILDDIILEILVNINSTKAYDVWINTTVIHVPANYTDGATDNPLRIYDSDQTDYYNTHIIDDTNFNMASGFYADALRIPLKFTSAYISMSNILWGTGDVFNGKNYGSNTVYVQLENYEVSIIDLSLILKSSSVKENMKDAYGLDRLDFWWPPLNPY